jgi:hypothetical protein
LNKRKGKGQVSKNNNGKKIDNIEKEAKSQADKELEMKRKEDEEQSLIGHSRGGKKKEEEEEKRNTTKSQEKELEQLNQVVVTNPITSMVTIPLEECTPLATILGNISFTSPGLGIECVVVVVGDYYYNHKTKAIEREPKREKEKDWAQAKTCLKETLSGKQAQILKRM